MNTSIQIIPIAQLNKRQLKAICQLHAESIPTLLGKLGMNFLLEYYRKSVQDPDVIAISALDSGGSVLGWAIGSTHPSQLTSQLRSDLPWFIKNLVPAIFRQPSLVFELANAAKGHPANDLSDRQLELTYIGVQPEFRSKGVGETLLTQFLDRARVFGANSVMLSVEVENEPAIHFYQKHGFQLITTFKEGGYHRHRMFFLLDPQKAIP